MSPEAKEILRDKYNKTPFKKRRRVKPLTTEQWDAITAGIKPPIHNENILKNGIPK